MLNGKYSQNEMRQEISAEEVQKYQTVTVKLKQVTGIKKLTKWTQLQNEDNNEQV